MHINSPAQGKIIKIGIQNNRWIISIFLNLFNNHNQYYPIDGVVLKQIHDTNGTHNIAYDLNKSRDNEKFITILQLLNFETIKITQIAGLVFRRIQTPNKVGTYVKKGEYLGKILFGSRVDIDLPINFKLNCKENDIVDFDSILAFL